LTQEEIGDRVCLDRSTISNHLRLLELPKQLQEDVETRRISAGHAKALLQVSNPERRRLLRDRVVREGLSVRAVEQLGRAIAGPVAKRKPRPANAVDPDLQRVIDQLRQRFQTRVRIQADDRRGRIEIEYFGAEDLERITGMLLGDV
jgi:ParB family chromosome partitioning protein